MKLAYNIVNIFLLVGLVQSGLWANTTTNKQEYTKVIEKNFDISADGTTQLYNKYGRIEVKTWDKNKVALKIIIEANAKSESKAEELFDRIQIDISNGSDYVRAETTIESKSKLTNWAKGDYKIYYEVSMPASNRLEAGMKYGNLQVETLTGAADVEVKYGNMQLAGVGDESEVRVAYGNGTIQNAEDINAQVSYGKLTIYKAEDVNVVSKYARVVIEEAEEVKSESKYDTYDIDEIKSLRNTGKYDNFKVDEVDEVHMTSKYTHVKIEELTHSANIDFSFGGATIEDVKEGFTEVNLVGNYAVFKLGIDPSADFQLETSGENAGIGGLGFLKLDQNKQINDNFDIVGHRGSMNTKSKVRAKLNYGSFKFLD